MFKGLDLLLQPFYSPLCLLCNENRITFPDLICNNCISNLPFLSKPFKPVEGDKFYLVAGAGPYEGSFGDMVRMLKFNNKTRLLPYLGECLCRVFNDNLSQIEFDAVVPVPLHIFRYMSRGFNQSALLARYLSKRIGIMCVEGWLKRCKHTKQQSLLKGTERLHNLEGAFKIKERQGFKPKHILLIDDVFTSGSTALACAKVMKDHGVKRVSVLTVARSIGANEKED
jgi:competence protein ComFC